MEDEGNLLAPIAEATRAEKLVNQAKKLKESIAALRGAKAEIVDERQLDALRVAFKGRKGAPPALDDRFGRTGNRVHMVARDARKGIEQFAAAEVQDCFGNAYVQLGATPAAEPDARLLVTLLQSLSEELKGREVASAFTYGPVQDLSLIHL